MTHNITTTTRSHISTIMYISTTLHYHEGIHIWHVLFMKEAFPCKKTQKNNIQQLHNHGSRREYTDSRCSRGLGVNPAPSAQRIHWAESEISWSRPIDCAVIYCVSLVSSDHGLYHIHSYLTTFILSFSLHWYNHMDFSTIKMILVFFSIFGIWHIN